MTYSLRYIGDPVLNQECEKVKDFSSINYLLNVMGTYLSTCHGIAAPQLGEPKKVIMANIGKRNRTFINPQILSRSGLITFPETCLSMPDELPCFKLRSFSVKVLYQNLNEEWKYEKFIGLSAIIMQHEVDHVYGKLIAD